MKVVQTLQWKQKLNEASD